MAKDRRAGRRSLCGALAALLCIGVAPSAMAWNSPQWVRQLGTSENDASGGVATDGDGNVYVSGDTSGSLGGPYQGGYDDAWVAKYSADGALLWKRQLGTSEDDGSGSVATDADGNVYLSGFTEGSLGGPYQGGYGDAWVAKYSADGALLWKRQLGTSELDLSGGVATDGEGNVYISGLTGGSLGGPSRGGLRCLCRQVFGRRRVALDGPTRK